MNPVPGPRSLVPGVVVRPLHTIPEFREVIALEHEIWGYDDPEDAVGIPVFVITLKRGGILLGAFDGDRLVGFAYSLAGLKRGTPMQWSHMLGVKAEYRGTGLGRRLKLEQRRIALEMGIELMEWTYDPLQAVNAHLNFQRLAVVVEEYHQNVYGESSSVLHRGNPTDRFIAQWWLRSDRVEAVIQGPGTGPFDSLARAQAALSSVEGGDRGPAETSAGVPLVLAAERRGDAVEPVRLDLSRRDDRLEAVIPTGFTEMLAADHGLAQAWRLATREVFAHYLAAGYRVTWFEFGPGPGQGRYTLQASGLGQEYTRE